MLNSICRCFIHAVFMLTVIVIQPAAGQTINEYFRLTASDGEAFDEFGHSVAVSGNTAIVGVPFNDDAGSASGSAYLFDTTTGQVLFKLTASDASSSDVFGQSVAISGNTAIVGANLDNDAGFDSGSAYLFDTTTGQELFKLTASDAAAFDYFGWSVAISGTTAIVGARRHDDLAPNSGSAYIFDTITGQQLYKLNAFNPTTHDEFGNSVAISGNTAIIGAWQDNHEGVNDSGSAYLFDISTRQQLKLTASDGEQGDHFGISVDISGTTAIVGSYSNGGSVYIFDTTTGQQRFKLTASEGARIGESVAICGTTAIFGAREADSYDGSAYIFDTTTGQQLYKLNAFNPAVCSSSQLGRSVAISGTTTIVGAKGNCGAGDLSGLAYLFNISPIATCPADLTEEGDLNFLDVSAFLAAYGQHNLVADFTGDGNLNFLDVSAFLGEYAAGCP
ncbi:MAG: GC-type dockerin domain-anchored protein [Phycisphaerales bacterium]